MVQVTRVPLIAGLLTFLFDVRYNEHIKAKAKKYKKDMVKKIIPITDGRKKLFKIAEEVQKPDTYYIFTVGGESKVVLMSQNEFSLITETMDILSDPDALKDLQQAEEDFKKGRYVSWDEVKKELGLMQESDLVLREKPKKQYGRKKKK